MIKESGAPEGEEKIEDKKSLLEIMKEDTFNDLQKKVVLLLENGNVVEANKLITKELGLFVSQALNDRGNKMFLKTKQEFDASLPREIRDALDTDSPQARIRIAEKRAAKLEYEASENRGAAQRTEAKAPDRLPEADWKIPQLKELKPGLVLEIKNGRNGFIFVCELLSEPQQDEEKRWHVQLRELNTPGGFPETKYLESMGMAPYHGYYPGWNSVNHPIWWGSKEEYEKKNNEAG